MPAGKEQGSNAGKIKEKPAENHQFFDFMRM
jgi:hypothetical protein